MNSAYEIQQIFEPTNEILEGLVKLTKSTVEHGASIGFLSGTHHAKYVDLWNSTFKKVADNETILLIAKHTATDLTVGTVQLHIDLPENQTHRTELAKMMVHADHRRNGIAVALLDAIEKIAKVNKKSLIVLDTATDSNAQKLYQKCGWIVAGSIPDYAFSPDGVLTGTTYMYKILVVGKNI